MFIILAGGLPNAILTPEEVRAVIQQMSGVHQLIVQLLYGSGLRLREAMQIRITVDASERLHLFGQSP
ncbi:MAG: hypothetical protein AAFY67_05520 [Cyanobacteria bacterium J06642_9]